MSRTRAGASRSTAGLLLQEGEERPAELLRLLDMRRMATVREHQFTIRATLSPIRLEDGARLRDHRLRRVDLRARPARHRAELAQVAQVEERGVRHDLVVRA